MVILMSLAMVVIPIRLIMPLMRCSGWQLVNQSRIPLVTRLPIQEQDAQPAP